MKSLFYVRKSLQIKALDYCKTLLFKTKYAEEWEPVKKYYKESNILEDDFLRIPDTFTLVKCNECNLVFVNPRLNDEIVNRFYEEYLSGKYADYIHMYDSNFREILFKDNLKLISEKLSMRSGMILDIGCATGRLLKVAKEFGWITYGIEVSETAALEAMQYGDIFIGDVLNGLCNYKNGKFDAITMIDSLEHVKSPMQTIKLTYDKLKSGGIIYIEVPNVESGLDEMTRHFHLFSFATLKQMLVKAGFHNIEEVFGLNNKYNPIDNEQHGRFIRVIAHKL